MGINLPTAIGLGTLGVLGLPALASGSLALGAGAAGGAAGGGLLGGLFGGGGMSGLLGLGTLAAAAGPYMFGDKLNYSNEKSSKKYEAKDYSHEYDQEYIDPEENYKPGFDPEHTYFRKVRRNYAMGGLVGRQMPAGGVPNMFAQFMQRGPMNMQRGQWSPPNMQQFGQQFGQNMQKFGQQFGQNMHNFGQDFQKNISQGIDQLRGSFDQARQQMQSQQNNWAPQPQPRQAFAGGGLVKGYAQGGLASLAGPQEAGEEPDDKTLIEQTALALMGQLDDPKPVLMEFVKAFGKEALNDLAERVQIIQQEKGQGPAGDGMSDSIPANLSEGEYVVPADVVSGLGNGSTDAGGKHLDSMVERARGMRGAPSQPPPVNPMAAMPV